MAKLTIKQEKFAQAYVETGNASEAYRTAYPRSQNWKPTSVEVNASKMLADTKVLLRIEQLRSEHRARHDVTIDSLTEDARDAIELAKIEGSPAAYVSAITLIAKLHGLLTEKHAVTGKDGAPLIPGIIKRVSVNPDGSRK